MVLTSYHLYYLIMWKSITPYQRFVDVSASRQKLAIDLEKNGLLTFEPFLTVTDKGAEYIADAVAFANNQINHG